MAQATSNMVEKLPSQLSKPTFCAKRHRVCIPNLFAKVSACLHLIVSVAIVLFFGWIGLKFLSAFAG